MEHWGFKMEDKYTITYKDKTVVTKNWVPITDEEL